MSLGNFFDAAVGLVSFSPDEIGAIQWNANGKSAALTLLALDPGITAVLLGDTFDDEQPQSVAFDSLMFATAHTAEPLKEVFLIFFADSQTSVPHGQDQIVIAYVGTNRHR